MANTGRDRKGARAGGQCPDRRTLPRRKGHRCCLPVLTGCQKQIRVMDPGRRRLQYGECPAHKGSSYPACKQLLRPSPQRRNRPLYVPYSCRQDHIYRPAGLWFSFQGRGPIPSPPLQNSGSRHHDKRPGGLRTATQHDLQKSEVAESLAARLRASQSFRQVLRDQNS